MSSYYVEGTGFKFEMRPCGYSWDDSHIEHKEIEVELKIFIKNSVTINEFKECIKQNPTASLSEWKDFETYFLVESDGNIYFKKNNFFILRGNPENKVLTIEDYKKQKDRLTNLARATFSKFIADFNDIVAYEKEINDLGTVIVNRT